MKLSNGVEEEEDSEVEEVKNETPEHHKLAREEEDFRHNNRSSKDANEKQALQRG